MKTLLASLLILSSLSLVGCSGGDSEEAANAPAPAANAGGPQVAGAPEPLTPMGASGAPAGGGAATSSQQSASAASGPQ